MGSVWHPLISASRGRLAVTDDIPTPKLLKGETPAVAVERISEHIAMLAREAKATAPTTVAGAKAQMRRVVEELANSGRPNVAL